MPLEGAASAGVDAPEGMAQLRAEEDCDDQVSVDMVTCGADALAMRPTMANGGSYLDMPREVCEDLMNELFAGLRCDLDDADCRRQSARRGDLAPLRAMARAAVPMHVGAGGFPPLMLQVGERFEAGETRMPASWKAAPPHGPPRLA